MTNQTNSQPSNLSNFSDIEFLQIDELIYQLKLVERFNSKTEEFSISNKQHVKSVQN